MVLELIEVYGASDHDPNRRDAEVRYSCRQGEYIGREFPEGKFYGSIFRVHDSLKEELFTLLTDATFQKMDSDSLEKKLLGIAGRSLVIARAKETHLVS